MTTTFTIYGREFAFATCPTCGAEHMISQTLFKTAQKHRGPNGHSVYCPNGHCWHYLGESEADKMRRERDVLKQQMARVEDEKREAEQRAAKAEAATRRLKKRAAAGTCPCCKRTVGALARHMATRHPEFVKEHTATVVPLKRA